MAAADEPARAVDAYERLTRQARRIGRHQEQSRIARCDEVGIGFEIEHEQRAAVQTIAGVMHAGILTRTTQL